MSDAAFISHIKWRLRSFHLDIKTLANGALAFEVQGKHFEVSESYSESMCNYYDFKHIESGELLEHITDLRKAIYRFL
jgi:hypothetical protein